MTNTGSKDDAPDKAIAYVVYILYFVGFSVGGIALLAGVIVAFLDRRRTKDRLLQSHYTFQIRMFWYALLGLITAIVVALAILITESDARLLIAVIALTALGVIAFLITVIVGIWKLYKDESFQNLS